MPKDVEGECNARLFLADDHGDNGTTFRCQRRPGHAHGHRERFPQPGGNGTVTVFWPIDESAICSNCGKREARGRMEDGQCCFTCPTCGKTRSIVYRGEDGQCCFVCPACGERRDQEDRQDGTCCYPCSKCGSRAEHDGYMEAKSILCDHCKTLSDEDTLFAMLLTKEVGYGRE